MVAATVRTAMSLAVVLAMGACAVAETPETSHEFTVTDEEGVSVARSTGGPKYDGELFEYERVLEIRADPDRPETIFYRASPQAIDDDGNIYVVDSSAHRIALFDDDGDWVRDIGREGQGPGEFQYPNRVEIVGGMVHVPDSRRRATHVFRRDGEFIELIHWPQVQRLGSLVPEVWWTPTGGAVVRLLNEPREDRLLERIEMVVSDEEGAELARTTSPWVWTGELHWNEIDGRRLGTTVFVHFSAQPWGGYVEDRGIWMTTGEEPIVWWHDLEGNAIARWEVDLPLAEISAQHRAAVETNLQQALEEALEPPPPGQEKPSPHMIQTRAANILFADHMPYWGIPWFDDRGFSWATEAPPPKSSSQPRSETFRMIVLSPEGEFLGYSTLPRPGAITDGRLLTTDVDPETEEPFPVVYRIRPAVAGLEYER